jgi:hypothetical protein
MLDPEFLRRLIRNFPENGLKLMLETPGNVHDLLQILQVRLVPRIDFGQMRVEAAHFVQPDYSHLESDLVLQAPLRPAGRRKGQAVTVFILIEHQSEPDRFLVFRVLEYVVAIYKRQMLAWERQYKNLDDFQFQPVLPVVLSSGTRTWDKLEALTALVAQAEGLEEVMPEFKPLFLNIGQTPGETLEERGGSFGLLLQLIQRRHKRLAVFEPTLRHAVRALEEQLAGQDRDRWLKSVSYINALIYHEREEPEREPLRQKVLDSVATDAHRAEVFKVAMGRCARVTSALPSLMAAMTSARVSNYEGMARQFPIGDKSLPPPLDRGVPLHGHLHALQVASPDGRDLAVPAAVDQLQVQQLAQQHVMRRLADAGQVLFQGWLRPLAPRLPGPFKGAALPLDRQHLGGGQVRDGRQRHFPHEAPPPCTLAFACTFQLPSRSPSSPVDGFRAGMTRALVCFANNTLQPLVPQYPEKFGAGCRVGGANGQLLVEHDTARVIPTRNPFTGRIVPCPAKRTDSRNTTAASCAAWPAVSAATCACGSASTRPTWFRKRCSRRTRNAASSGARPRRSG